MDPIHQLFVRTLLAVVLHGIGHSSNNLKTFKGSSISFALCYFTLRLPNSNGCDVGCPAKLVSFRYNRNRNRKKFRNYPKQEDLFRFFRNIPKLERFGSFGSFGSIKKEPKVRRRREREKGKGKGRRGKERKR
jgi:hypothetical protein